MFSDPCSVRASLAKPKHQVNDVKMFMRIIRGVEFPWNFGVREKKPAGLATSVLIRLERGFVLITFNKKKTYNARCERKIVAILYFFNKNCVGGSSEEREQRKEMRSILLKYCKEYSIPTALRLWWKQLERETSYKSDEFAFMPNRLHQKNRMAHEKVKSKQNFFVVRLVGWMSFDFSRYQRHDYEITVSHSLIKVMGVKLKLLTFRPDKKEKLRQIPLSFHFPL